LWLWHALTHRDEDSGAEELHEYAQCGGTRNLGHVEHGLSGDQWQLQSQTDTEAADDLVSDPLWRTCVNLKSGEEACTDRRQHRAGEHESSIITDVGDEGVGKDGSDDNAKQNRNVSNAGFVRADALHGLEPDGEVVDGREESGTHEEGKTGRGPHAAFLEHERTDSCVFGSPELDADEG
jgi:hypothetical protein